jgi:hypothetical protein
VSCDRSENSQKFAENATTNFNMSTKVISGSAAFNKTKLRNAQQSAFFLSFNFYSRFFDFESECIYKRFACFPSKIMCVILSR